VKTLRFTWTLSPKGHFFIFGTDFTDYTVVFLCSGIRDSVFAYGYAATRPNRRCEMSRQGALRKGIFLFLARISRITRMFFCAAESVSGNYCCFSISHKHHYGDQAKRT
jgi:hypothetical protein